MSATAIILDEGAAFSRQEIEELIECLILMLDHVDGPGLDREPEEIEDGEDEEDSGDDEGDGDEFKIRHGDDRYVQA